MMTTFRLLGATALATSALVAVTAHAQTATPAAAKPSTVTQEAAAVAADEGSGDAIVVTGSRIPRPEYQGVLPGVQISSEQIAARGFINALEAINDLPLVGPGASPLNGNNGGQAASLGAAFIDILDLGTQRTLTLVNGRRFVSGNAASLFVEGNASGAQVDVNSIPASLIKRVDVLTVGGAAAYGSDAIAGVVNFILDDNYEGLEVRGQGGISNEGDAGQWQASLLAGKNFLDKRLNVTFSLEYSRSDGLQADARAFQRDRWNTTVNFANGGKRNPNFTPAIIDITGLNNGAFLRNSDDGIPASGILFGSVNQSVSFNGTVLLPVTTTFPARYTPSLVNRPSANNGTAQYIQLQNGLALANSVGSGATGAVNQSFFNTGVQIINGLASGNGLNGRTTAATGLPITTFAPTALPTGVTAAQAFTQFNVTPPTGATAAQLTTLAVNVLQANRPTAREFYANNPNVPLNYFLGTFHTNVPRIANTDTTLVNVAGVQVPVNQVLPFVAVPLEFNKDGTLRTYTAGVIPQGGQGTLAALGGGNGGNIDGLRNTVLRTQQDRFIGNLNAKWDVTDNITLFTENLYSYIKNVSLRNGASANSISTSDENAPLLLNVSNPYLSQQARDLLNTVGINSTTRGGNFMVTRTNQDIFGDNSFTNTSETFRLVGGARGKWEMFGHKWSAEASATYGYAKQITNTTSIKDIEYQLALDVAVDPATNTIKCRAQLFPGDYLGRTPNGTVTNLSRLPGAGGVPTDQLITPTITQAMIDGCAPLNPFGFNNMSQAAKDYVRADVEFRNISKQTFLQGTVTGAFFDLPAGEVGLSGTIEYRKESLDFSSNTINQLGRTRTAPSAQTQGEVNVLEYGGEARIPIFGGDFLGFMGELEFSPSIRVSRQDGSAPTFRTLQGNLQTQTSNGSPQTIWSLAGTWKLFRDVPVLQDILLRGNVTRSIRQPGIVELFLGGQPAFSVTTDVCGPAAIDAGSQAVNRRSNCRKALIASGLATDNASADAFFTSFVPNNISIPGTFSGASTLRPERGRSWTAGMVFTPRFVPDFQFSIDYINLDLLDTISPTTPSQAVQLCYDSNTYNDTSAATGVNTCSFFTRGPDFQIQPGFVSGYINLAATRIRAFNMSANYKFDLPANLGSLSLYANAYNLRKFDTSALGNFTDVISSAGTFNRPKWEVQGRVRYSKGDFFGQLVWNWRAPTRIFASGLPATIENWADTRYPGVSTFDLTMGADLSKNIRLQANVVNLTNQNYAGLNGLIQGAFIDQIGRRFLLSARVKY
jgi:outer membrane receptor protein involved in Fe transport